MDRRTAKEFLHLRDWLDKAQLITDAGRAAYAADDLLQEAGDSLMMKIGEAANRLARAGVPGPGDVDWSIAVANRNWLIHQYDHVDRAVTWATLTKDLPSWRESLAADFDRAASTLAGDERVK